MTVYLIIAGFLLCAIYESLQKRFNPKRYRKGNLLVVEGIAYLAFSLYAIILMCYGLIS